MAKKKPKPPTTGDKRIRSGASIQAFIDPDIRVAVDEFIDGFNSENEHKATLTSTLEAALKMYLSAKGYWPRKGKPKTEQ